MLFLKYEDMKKDIRSHIVQMASFMNCEISDKGIKSFVEIASFSSMKNNPTVNHEWIPPKRRHPEGTPFIRKRVVGGEGALFCQAICSI